MIRAPWCGSLIGAGAVTTLSRICHLGYVIVWYDYETTGDIALNLLHAIFMSVFLAMAWFYIRASTVAAAMAVDVAYLTLYSYVLVMSFMEPASSLKTIGIVFARRCFAILVGALYSRCLFGATPAMYTIAPICTLSVWTLRCCISYQGSVDLLQEADFQMLSLSWMVHGFTFHVLFAIGILFVGWQKVQSGRRLRHPAVLPAKIGLDSVMPGAPHAAFRATDNTIKLDVEQSIEPMNDATPLPGSTVTEEVDRGVQAEVDPSAQPILLEPAWFMLSKDVAANETAHSECIADNASSGGASSESWTLSRSSSAVSLQRLFPSPQTPADVQNLKQQCSNRLRVFSSIDQKPYPPDTWEEMRVFLNQVLAMINKFLQQFQVPLEDAELFEEGRQYVISVLGFQSCCQQACSILQRFCTASFWQEWELLLCDLCVHELNGNVVFRRSPSEALGLTVAQVKAEIFRTQNIPTKLQILSKHDVVLRGDETDVGLLRDINLVLVSKEEMVLV